MSLVFTINDKSLIVTGKTFHAKEHLKSLGGKWSGSAWSLPLDADTPENRAALEGTVTLGTTMQKAADKAVRDYADSPSAKFQYAKSRGWTCCDKANVMDAQRGHVGCFEHGFHVKGILRTGD